MNLLEGVQLHWSNHITMLRSRPMAMQYLNRRTEDTMVDKQKAVEGFPQERRRMNHKGRDEIGIRCCSERVILLDLSKFSTAICWFDTKGERVSHLVGGGRSQHCYLPP